jgi:hypothetical protein
MPFGIRPSNVRVCHSTTRAFEFGIRPKSSVNLRVLATRLGLTRALARDRNHNRNSNRESLSVEFA